MSIEMFMTGEDEPDELLNDASAVSRTRFARRDISLSSAGIFYLSFSENIRDKTMKGDTKSRE